MKNKTRMPAMAGAMVLLMALSLMLAAFPASAEDRPSDETITLWVKDALLEDVRVPVIGINVSANDGIVKLTGTVNNLAAKKYAGLETMKIKGVRGVINEISVDAPFRYDFDIAQDVLQRILDSSSIKTRNVDVDVTGGNVTLSGSVASLAEADQAQLLATETKGVNSVTNNLTVTYPNKRSDNAIRKDVQAALARDVYVTGLPISVSVKNGVVTLKGKVGTAYQKERAASDVRWIWNVTKVDNKLSVAWWDSGDTRKKPAVPTDDQLKQAVNDALFQDLRITDPGDIGVDAFAGQVTLRGSVPTFYQKRIAEKDANDVVGTAWVTNLLQVNAEPRSDSAILDDVSFELAADYALDYPDSITAQVKNRVVTLTGDVNSFWDKAHAYDVVSSIEGVRGVINNIKVHYSAEYTDASIRKRIQDRLAANAETMWVADDIKVTVNNGKATLTGTVNYWSEYDAAEDVAFKTNGVWAVTNQLNVRDYDDYEWTEFVYPWPDVYVYDLHYPGYVYYYWR
jgi:osmotically-inducible protein OsmY